MSKLTLDDEEATLDVRLSKIYFFLYKILYLIHEIQSEDRERRRERRREKKRRSKSRNRDRRPKDPSEIPADDLEALIKGKLYNDIFLFSC